MPKKNDGGNPWHNYRSLTDVFRMSLAVMKECPSIIPFILDTQWAGNPHRRPYPVQLALLKLIYLSIDEITAAEWKLIRPLIERFYIEVPRKGIVPDVLRRAEILLEQGYRRFPEIVFIAGRRAGKGLLGAWIAAYELYWEICLHNPQVRYGIDPSKTINFFVAATTLPQAKANLYTDIVNVVIEAECFKGHIAHVSSDLLVLNTPADQERARRLAAEGINRGWQNGTLRVQAISSNSPALRGSAVKGVFFDELGHLQSGTTGPQTADQLVKSILPSLAQFGKDRMIYIPTSPRTKEGPAHDFYEAGLATDETTGEPQNPARMVIQLPSWGTYEGHDNPELNKGKPYPRPPIQYDEFVKSEERRDPQGALVEYHGQFQEVTSPFLPSWTVDKMFSPICPHCAHTVDDRASTCAVCGGVFESPRIVQPRFEGVNNEVYRCHLDPAESGANFAMVIAHVEYKLHPDGQLWAHVFVDHIHVWKPADYRNELPYDDIVAEIGETLTRFPTTEVVSTDQFNAGSLIPMLRTELKRRGLSARVVKEPFTQPANRERAYSFRVAANINLVHCIKDNYGPRGTSLSEREMRSLQEVRGVVDAPTSGPVQTKDVADGIMELSRQFLEDQFKRGPRKHISDLRMQMGARGGFRSGSVEGIASARDTLRRHSDEASRRTVPGDGKPTRPRWKS